MAEPLPNDPTLDEIRVHLAPIIASHAAFDGWTEVAIERAANEAGVAWVMAEVATSPVVIPRAWTASRSVR